MTLELVKKSRNGDITLRFSENPNDKPKTVVITKDQLGGLIDMLQLAQKSDSLTFSIEV